MTTLIVVLDLAYLLLLNHIMRHQPAATGEDGRKAMEVALALYLSHHTKKTITLPLDETPPIKEIFIQLREESRKRAAK